jgi:uncharacterized small protein (DUF1192 family)
MKCDELKAETIVPQGCTITLQMYPKAEVEAAIAELKKENARLKDELDAANNQCENLINSATDIMLRQDKVNDTKCAEIESLKASHYAEMVDADENLRWRKTSEEIPSENDYYLVSDGKNVFMEYGSYNEQDEVWNWDHGENMDTWKYWRPMPKAPEEAK